MALVDYDEVEEVRRVLAEVGRGFAILGRPAHEGLENGEEDAAVFRDLALLADVVRLDADQSVIGERREGSEVVEGLVGKGVAVGKEEDARTSRGWRSTLPVSHIPASVEELPRDLECNRSLSCAGRQCQEQAVLAVFNRLQHSTDRNLLVKAK